MFDKAHYILTAALAGDGALSRLTVISLLESGGISAHGERGSHILRYLAKTLAITTGPAQGTTPTVTLYSGRIPPTRTSPATKPWHVSLSATSPGTVLSAVRLLRSSTPSPGTSAASMTKPAAGLDATVA